MNADIFEKQNSCVPIEKTEVDIKIKLTKNWSPVIKRTQYPLILTWVPLFINSKDYVCIKLFKFGLIKTKEFQLWTNLCSIK